MVATKNPRRKFFVFAALAALAWQTGCTPPGPRALMRGDELLRKNKPVLAVAELKRATELLPQEPRAWNLLGIAYHRSGQSALAAEAYRQALRRDRSNAVAVAHYNLGCLLLEQNAPALAADELRSYTLITNNLAGLVKLGAAQLRLHQWNDAEHSYNAALRLDSKNTEALNGIGAVHAQRNQRDAMQYFNAALQANSKYGPALLNSAIVAQQSPATKPMALQRYKEFLAAQPSSRNAEIVRSLTRQLEVELAPAPPPVVSVPGPLAAAPKTNPPPVITNAKPQFIAAKSNALAAVLKTNPIVASANVPALPTNPPLTVVSVTNQPPIKIAATEVTPGPVRTDVTSSVTPSVTVAPPPDISPALIGPTGESESKPGFFSRLNPFRGKSGAPSDSARTVILNSSNVVPGETTGIGPAGSRPTFPRYAYLSPTQPAAGDRKSAERIARQAEGSYRAHKTNEALTEYRNAATADPSYFEAQYYAALLAFQLGDLKRALAGWETALALEPESMNARYSFALTLKQSNFAYDAANELERMIVAKPQEARAHLALGNLYAQQLNEPEKARLHYGKFLELEPRSPLAPTIRFWLAANP